MSGQDDSLLTDYVAESCEHLAGIETDLLDIEQAGAAADEELVNKVFRAAHSIKGGAGFLNLTKIQELAHKTENVLSMVRSREMVPSPEVINILLMAFDRLRELLNNYTQSNDSDISDMVVALTGLTSSYLPPDRKQSMTTMVDISLPGGRAVMKISAFDFDQAKKTASYIYLIEYDMLHDIHRLGKTPLDVFKSLMAAGTIIECVFDIAAVGGLNDEASNRIPYNMLYATILEPNIIDGLVDAPRERIHLIYDSSAAKAAAPAPPPEPAAPVVQPPPVQQQSAPPPGPAEEKKQGPAEPAAAESTLRVHVNLLENLMNLAGELVLSRNQLHTAVAQNNLQSLSAATQRINQVTTELQDAVMQTRLQPIGNVFSKFPRVVRDMAKSLHKEIQIDIRGKDVALDRSLIEGLSDPLTHMVRNSVDHGIETPEERARAGKKSTGTVRIEARHEAGQIVVEIADDGKGINAQKVADAALARGLITQEKLQGMSDDEKVALIFLPGLSTAAKVSDISGRGVGMDVVKTNLDRLGGKVEIKSEPGRGSLFRIKLPLTLAIIPALIVSVGEERFAVPQINIEELLRIRAEDVKRRIEVVADAEVLLLRDRIIPLVRFASVLDVTPAYLDPATGATEIDRRVRLADRRSPRHDLTEAASSAPAGKGAGKERCGGRRLRPASALEIAVVTTGTMQYGLVVDTFHDTEEIVVKPLGRHLKGLREYAGATILGDGTVALILDIAGLAAKADLAAVAGSARAAEVAAEAERERLEDTHSLLLFHNAPDEVCATPLDTVLRLERITPAQVETAGGLRTMQYRGASLPLVTLADAANVKAIESAQELAVVVSSVHGREVGLLGAMPVDVIEARADIDQMTHRQKGIAGSAIIHDRTTLIVDLFELVDAAYPEWTKERSAAKPVSAGKERPVVLLAEDSDFFRNQVKKFLEEDGFAVLDAPDGQAAWELLSDHVQEVCVVLTDIEMPRLTGLELAARIRADERTAGLPVVAVTSLASEEDMAKGKAAGVNEYQIKLDRDRLLSCVHDMAVKV